MATTKSTTKKKQTTFEKLSSINVNKYVEKKAGLTYLSWAYAWAETKKHCPDARYEILDTTYDEAIGFMCNTQVTIEGETLSMWLPVMDSKNQSMKKHKYTYTTRYGEKEVAGATTTDINKTIMRCLTKNLAMFGLGIYIYAGEDMPMEEEKVVSSKTPTASGKPTLTLDSDDWKNVSRFVTEKKDLGFKKICDKISLKFTLTAVVKNEIKNLIK
mgnify:CR=1 FL=1|tara:strand:+ start:6635 stop:7279 length:645 start_codon:yes stop_codon:yes gene_type:complete